MALSIGGSRRHSSHRGGPSSGPGPTRPPPNLINPDKNKIPPIDEKQRGLSEPLLRVPKVKNGVKVDLSGGSISSSIPPGPAHPHHSRSDTFKCFALECNCFVAYLLLGLFGFVVFWSILMLRIYLPEKYWEWSYIWGSEKHTRMSAREAG